MPFGESNVDKKIETREQPAKDKGAEKEALKSLTIKIYKTTKENIRKVRQEKGEKSIELFRKKTSEKEKKYPSLSELKNSARKYGFDEVLINEEGLQIASAFPDKIIFFPEKCFLPLSKIKEFAPEFAKKGIDSVFSYQSQFLKGGALEMGKKLYNEMGEYFLITKTMEAMPKVQADLKVKGIFLDTEVIEKIRREEKEKLRKMNEEIKRLSEEREIKVWEQDKLSAGNEEEAAKKLANYLVFVELLYNHNEDNHIDNIGSILGKESLILSPSLPKKEEGKKFGEGVISESKKIKSELGKKYEQWKTGSMYG